MLLTSPVFKDQGIIPKQFTGEDQNISPPLEWSGVPAGCKELALICEDPDAPRRSDDEGPFVHWLIYNIAPSITSLPQGLDTQEKINTPLKAIQGKNSFEEIGYGGPMPPVGHGIHHYIFRLYALNSELKIPPGATKKELLQAMQGHVLDAGQLTGKYKREAISKSA